MYGCTDPTACNYNEDAIIDIGSCSPTVECTDGTFVCPPQICSDESPWYENEICHNYVLDSNLENDWAGLNDGDYAVHGWQVSFKNFGWFIQDGYLQLDCDKSEYTNAPDCINPVNPNSTTRSARYNLDNDMLLVGYDYVIVVNIEETNGEGFLSYRLSSPAGYRQYGLVWSSARRDLPSTMMT